MSLYLTLSANFRTGKTLPTISDQYHSLWQLATALDAIGIPIAAWCPPADTPSNARLNSAFDTGGPTVAALALANADKANRASDLRTLGVWNGEEDAGGMAFTTTYNTGPIPSNLELNEESISAFEDYRNVAEIVSAIVAIWKPMVVKVIPWDYDEHAIFPDRPPVGWMLYLPIPVTAKQVPEAAKIISIFDGQKKLQGSLIVATTDVFDVENPAHIKQANAIETRLVDQDLLPTLADFLIRS